MIYGEMFSFMVGLFRYTERRKYGLSFDYNHYCMTVNLRLTNADSFNDHAIGYYRVKQELNKLPERYGELKINEIWRDDITKIEVFKP